MVFCGKMGRETILNGLRYALAMFSGKNIYNFAFVALCGALQTLFSQEGLWRETAAAALVSCGNSGAVGKGY